MLGFFANIINYFVSLFGSGFLYAIAIIVRAAKTDEMLSTIANNWVNYPGKYYSSLDSYAETIFNLLSPIGCGLVIAFFFIELINQLAKDNLTGYTLLKAGVQLIFAFGIIIYGFQLCTSITGIGIWFVNSIAADGEFKTSPDINAFIIGSDALNIPEITKDDNYLSIYQKLTQSVPNDEGGDGLLDKLKAILGFNAWARLGDNIAVTLLGIIGIILALIYWLIIKIIHVILILQCVSRAIQIAIYAALCPIGISAWFSGGSIMTSTAMRYVKKLLALAIQGGIMLMILKFAALLTASDAANPFLTLVGPLTAVALFSKSNQIANDVCGT